MNIFFHYDPYFLQSRRCSLFSPDLFFLEPATYKKEGSDRLYAVASRKNKPFLKRVGTGLERMARVIFLALNRAADSF
ncbi:hypothetical protein D3A96_05575 [Robertkochia marina]|nr:hypothetical protein D3A96_05575 [Robertkochia marina]